MSATAKQIAANRRNSQLSTGPRTGEGKAVSCLNSTTHGLTGQALLMPAADDDIYAAYYADMLVDLAPSGAIEFDLARRIVCDSWRLNRAGALDINLLNNCRREDRDPGNYEFPHEDQALAEARAFRADAKTFNLLSLYEQRLQRSFQKNLALLKALQKERKAEPVKAAPQAKSAQRMAPQPIDIPMPLPENGFVCARPSAAPHSPPSALANDIANMAA